MQLHIIITMSVPEIPELKMAAWVALMRSQETLLRAIETALKAADMPPLTWYDVLLELDRSGDDGLRPMELEKRLLLPQYGMSRLLDRMGKAGLVERIKAPDDGRGQIIKITAGGRARRQEMWPIYASVLDSAFAGKLTDQEAETLRNLLFRFRQPGTG